MRPTTRILHFRPMSFVLLVSLATSPLVAEEAARDWPEFHGRKRDNITQETGLLKAWPAGGPKRLFTSSACGKGYASVAIAGGRLFTSGDVGAQEMVIALDMQGRPLWKTPNGASWKGASPGSRSTPTVRDGVVYHMNPTGRIAAYRADTGKEIWAVDLRERFSARYGAWAMSENVVVEEKAVLCAPGGRQGYIVALDRATGKPLWANTDIKESAAYGSPIVIAHDGVRQMITLMRRSVVSVDVRTGALLWKHRHETPYGVNVTTPVVHDGHVFVTGGYAAGGRLLKIGPENRSVKEVWAKEDLDSCHGGVILRDGYLYGSGCRTYKRGFLCVEFATGRTMWRNKPLEKLSLAYADGLLYGLGHLGVMWLIKPDPKACRVVSQFTLPSRDRYDNLAHPVVCDGRLYIRQAEHLFVYDVKAP